MFSTDWKSAPNTNKGTEAMTTRKIILAATTALFITSIASPAFAKDHVEANEALFETKTTTQITPVAQPHTIIATQPKTLAEKAFDLSDGK